MDDGNAYGSTNDGCTLLTIGAGFDCQAARVTDHAQAGQPFHIMAAGLMD